MQKCCEDRFTVAVTSWMRRRQSYESIWTSIPPTAISRRWKTCSPQWRPKPNASKPHARFTRKFGGVIFLFFCVVYCLTRKDMKAYKHRNHSSQKANALPEEEIMKPAKLVLMATVVLCLTFVVTAQPPQ